MGAVGGGGGGGGAVSIYTNKSFSCSNKPAHYITKWLSTWGLGIRRSGTEGNYPHVETALLELKLLEYFFSPENSIKMALYGCKFVEINSDQIFSNFSRVYL